MALCQQLAAQYPNVPQYRLRLAGGLHHRGLLLEGAGKRREAGDAYRREFDLAQALATRYPTVSNYVLVATAANDFLRCPNESGIGAAKWSRQQLASVLTNLKEVAANPHRDPGERFALAEALKQLAEGLRNAGDPAAAVSAFREAILVYRQLIQEQPKDFGPASNSGTRSERCKAPSGQCRGVSRKRSKRSIPQSTPFRRHGPGTKEGPKLAFPGGNASSVRLLAH